MNSFINPLSGVEHHNFTVIMSAWHTHGLTLETARADLNMAYHIQLGLRLNDAIGKRNSTECQGMYDGTTEDSYICACHDIVEVMALYELGKEYNQECILVIDHRAEVVGLMYMDGQVSRIGHNLVQACDTIKGDYTQIGSHRYVVA